ncbi:T9SS type B sorting domain-containing protein [Flavobacterium phycosphaerae]|uniref:T9SS type B sorting domain-containing protein n=1 Tax=Flavobacterium phycosphaerae TaxID=2697515 RepID=UPI001389AC1E|nr:gliding motility-associated C-terminal domain-containing protein [Flavobacterium phycosphaerae]
MKSKSTISKKLYAFLIFSLLSISMTYGQAFPPANTSCTSKDLEIVAAQLTGGDVCNSCPTATTLTRTLTLGIKNTTGSTRTSFAFWGMLEIYSGTTGALISSVQRTGCGGPLPGGSTTYLSFGDITYTCGDVIKISNIWEAWTTASGSEVCPLDPNNISPKCGKIPSITVNGGVNGEFVLTSSQCGSATGAIDLTPTGGTSPFTYTWTASDGGVVPVGQANNQDLTGLVSGTYTVVIKDANNCTITKSRTITATTPAVATFNSTSNITVACGSATTSSLSYTNSGSGSCLISGSVTSTLSTQTPAGACGGTVTETWTFTDAYGRTITKTRTITVSPAALPTMTAPANTTVACGALPAPSTIAFSNGLTGGCLVSGTSNPSTFSATPNACGGTVTETWTATDSCGRALAPVSRTITVSPAALPTMTAPAATTVTCGALPAPSTISFSNGLTGGCLVSGTSNPSTFSATPNACGGTVTETWTATDSCGRALAPVSRTITVSPADLPTMTAPAATTVACGALPAPSTISFSNGLTGGCLVSGTSNPSTFSATPNACGGTVTETWTATDSCGRALAPVSRTITISPAALPTMTAPANTTVACGALPAPSTISFSNGLTGGCLVSGTSNPSTFSATPNACGGTVTETWTATDSCGRALAPVSRTITVSPAALPTMTAPAATTVACGALPAPSTISFSNGLTGGCLVSGTSNPSTFSATPNACGGTVTETWTATDSCGRAMAPVSRTITVSPADLPTMTAPAATTVACGALPAPSTISFSNGLTGGCLVSGTSNPSTFSATPNACGGTVTETWTATDSCGRALAPVSRTITVSPADLPTMTAPAATTVACGALPAPSTIAFSNGLTGGCLVSGTSNPSTFSATPNACGGTVTETWTATDSCGRALAPVSRTITVSPAALPTMTAPAATTVACGALPAPSTIAFSNGLTGGCLVSGTSNPSTFSATPNACGGTVTETWTATDSCGRALAPVSRTITVSPADLPTMTAPAATTVACGALPAPSTISFSNGLTGGCLVSGTSNPSTFSATPNACGGTVTETWTATDSCGRALAPVSRTITISPAALPTMTAPAATTVACGALPAPSTIAFSNGLTGGCLVSGTSNPSTFSATPNACGGTVTETWTATDSCGRALAPVSRTITVSPADLPTMTAPAATTVACGALPESTTISFSNGLTGGCLVSGTSNPSTFSATPNACGGTVTETWTATDSCGRALAPVSRTITVSPADLPTMTAPAATTVACGALPAPSTIAFSNGLTGGCLVSGTSNPSTFSATPNACGGTVTETWTATDSCGRALAPVSRTITVSPADLPTMTAPAATTVACGALPAPSTIAFSNSLTGGCLVSGTSNPSTFSATPNACGGTVTETWTATDSCGRALAPVSRTIIVSPADLPTMTALAPITVTCGAVPESTTIPFTNGLSGGCLLNGTSNPSTFTTTVEGYCNGKVVETWTATDACGRELASVSRTITVDDNIAPTFTTPDNITINTDANCNVNLDPTATGGVKNPSDNCDPNPTVSYVDNDCFGNFTEGSVNAGTGNYFTFDISGFDNLTAKDIEKVALAFDTNQGKGRVQFTLVSPSGQGVVLVGPYCNGGNCDTTNTTELYLPIFYPNASGYPQWNNANIITSGSTVNLTPNGNLSGANTINGLTSYVSGFENLTGPMNGTWFVYAQKVGNELGAIRFKSVCLTPANTCPNNKVITRTWTVTDMCGNSTSGNQTIKIQDVTAPNWDTATGSLDRTLECSDTAGITAAQVLAPIAIDNCAGTVTYTKTSSAFVASQGCINAGTYTNTWIAKDVCSNTSTVFTQKITIQDTTAPIWTTANGTLNMTVECSDNQALEDAQALFPVASDLCDADVTNIVKKGGNFVANTNCANTGTYTNTWSVMDACGNNSVEFTQVITVVDTTKPQITTSASDLIVQCDGSGNSGALQQWLDNHGGAVASDSCSNVTWSNNFASIASDCSAAVTVIFKATDGCNNSETTSATFTIQDTIAPIWSTFAGSLDKTLECSDLEGLATANTVFPTATDNCDSVLTNIVKTNGQFAPSSTCSTIGTYTNTWKVTDTCGNASENFVQTITIIDTTKPTFTAPADITIYTTDACTYDASVQFTGDVTDEADNCSTDLNATFTDADPVAGACAGSYTIVRTWSLTDCAGNNTTHDQTITVSDNIKPTFTVPADITIYTTDACTYDASVTFTGDVTDEADNCSTDLNATFTDATPVAGACAGSYTIVRTWSLTDCAGNNTTHDQTITVSDNIKPTFTAPADITIYTTDACTYDASVQFTGDVTDEADNCSTDLNATFTDATPVAGQCAGSYTIVRTWSLTDCAGNNTTHDQTITVSDNIKPTFTVPADITIYTTDACTYDASVTFTGDVTDEADNCSTELNATFTDATPVAGACAGSYTIVRSWSLTDCAGNNTTHDQTITVSDNIKPTFTAPADITIYTTDACTYDASVQFTGDVTDEADNCSTDLNATFTDADPVAGECSGGYAITRTWSLTDCAGNTTTHTQLITLTDNIAPTFTAPADITIYTTDACTYDASVQFTGDVTDEADNCSITNLNATFTDAAPVAGQCAGSYTIVRTWSLTDCSNNNTTHDQTITVLDNIKPTFTAPADITIYTTDACTYDASVQFTGDVTDEADNCSTDLNAAFTDATPVAGACAGSYTIVRTWSLTDCVGNNTTHDQTITVSDNIKPTFTVPADITIYTTDACTYDASVTFTGDVTDEADNCSTDLNATFTDAAPVAGACAGSYTIVRTWSLTDCAGNNTTHDQTITVSDNIKPTFTAPADITIYTTDACTYDASVQFTGDVTDEADNCSTGLNATFTDAAPVAGACAGAYTIVRTWSLTDCAGNNTTHDQTITVSDNIKPTFTAPADITIYTTDACTYDASVTFTGDVTDEADNCSTDLNAIFTDAAPVAGACAGSYTIVRTWSLTDCAGNNTTHDQTITVSDNIKPTFTVPADITIYTTDACTYDASVQFTGDVTDETDNCSTDLNATFTDATPVAGACAGSYTIVRTWSLTDCAGNNTTHDQTITVSDNIKPTFTAPSDITIYTTDACTYDASVQFTGDVTDETDNCSTDLNATFTDATPVAGACAGSYTIVRTWSLTDCAGNNTTHDQTITVSDNIKPTFTAPTDITIYTTDACTYDASVTFTGDVTDEADNCSTDLNATFTDAAPLAGACAGSYTIVRTWSLTDCAGNTTTHDQTITVSDNIKPTFTVPASITIYTTDTCTYDTTVTFTGDVTDEADNCSTGLEATYTDGAPVVGACAGSYTITRTWSLTDCAGNTTTQYQTITVSDNIKPIWATLAGSLDVTLECSDAQGLTNAQALAPQATDNCTANVTYIKTPGSYVAGDCPNRGTYTNTWVAIDACSNATLAAFTQVITIQDTTKPVLDTTTFDPNPQVTCNNIPPTPALQFSDNCSSVNVPTPVETQTPVTNNAYTITRTWTATDECGNVTIVTQTIDVTIQVQPGDVITAPDKICNDDDISVTWDLENYLTLGTPLNGTWTNVDNVGTLTGSIFNANQVAVGNHSFIYTYDNGSPCPQNITVIMPVQECGGVVVGCDDIEVHNAFTPNGDGVNEYFDIEFIDQPCHQPNSVEIYNRWGVLVYETKNYDNNTRKFTGVSEGRSTVSKSDELPAGTYFYILQYSDGNGNTVTESKYLYLTR